MYNFIVPLFIYNSGFVFILITVFCSCIPSEWFSLTTFFEKKIEWFFIFILTYGCGTVTRCEHILSQIKPFLRSLFGVCFTYQLFDIWVHLKHNIPLSFKRLMRCLNIRGVPNVDTPMRSHSSIKACLEY